MRSFLALLAVVVGAAAAPAVAHAAPPANDNFAAAAALTIPSIDVVEVSEATQEPGEPQFCWFSSQTVWYSITLAHDAMLRVGLGGSAISSNTLSLYRAAGGGFGGLAYQSCASFGSPLTFSAQAGVTYYLQAGALFGSFGSLRLAVEEILPPANDSFGAATAIDAVPFADTKDLAAAGLEPSEPTPSCGGGIARSIWYRYSPSSTGSVSASGTAGFYPQPVAVYTGTGVGALTEVGCRNYGSSVLTFRAVAGTTYYVQLGAPASLCCGSVVTFSLRPAPAPTASFVTFPSDPSQFDAIEFWGQSFDPGGAGFVEESYDFGDGTSALGCCPNVIGWPPDAIHTYAVDGDYAVVDTVTTADGRVASATRTIQVRTHDVAVEKLAVPQTASIGQSRSISVSISNVRYDERVKVQLLVGVAGSDFREVGALEQVVVARKRSTQFPFSYTFSAADAVASKVTFKAIATIVGARDAIPVDNTAVAPPTRVNG